MQNIEIDLKASDKYKIIKDTSEKRNIRFTVYELCEIASVSKSGYYNWLNNADKRESREIQDKEDFDLILEAYNYKGIKKGAKSIYMRLLRHNPPVVMNIKKIRRLMKKYGLFCKIRVANPYKRMIKAIKSNRMFDNTLNREFRNHGARTILLTDITYIRLNDGFAYLSVILDAYTKECLSHVLSPNLQLDFVLETVNQLMKNHGKELHTDALLHSDQGIHYRAIKFVTLIKDLDLRQSMSRKGNCWDNSPQESFFGHMKDDIKDKVKKCHTYEELKQVIGEYIDYYNNERYQWDLAKLSPVEYYKYITTGEYPIALYKVFGNKEKPKLPNILI